ncbi:MAG: hypothetical protein R6U89_05720 [Dehalococcoidia bacterium]
MQTVVSIIESRVKAYGIEEPVVQRPSENRIKVYLPGTDEIEEAASLIGKHSIVKFKEFRPITPEYTWSHSYFAFTPDENGNPELIETNRSKAEYVAIPAAGEINSEKRQLTSRYFKGNVEVRIPKGTDSAEICFYWNDTGSTLFYHITSRLSTKLAGSVERRLAIFVGNDYISSPVVNEPMRDGAVIPGISLSKARRVATIINTGQLPVSLQPIDQCIP